MADFAKSWFLPGAMVQYLCSIPMQKHANNLQEYFKSTGRNFPKSRDAVMVAAGNNPHLIPIELLEKYLFWQSVSIFLGGALLCSIALMAISFLKFI